MFLRLPEKITPSIHLPSRRVGLRPTATPKGVDNTKNFIKKDDPIKPVESTYICSNVSDITKNKSDVVALNRGIHCIIESLVNYSRVDKVKGEKLDYFLGRFNENSRVINKVGSKQDKEAMKMIKKSLKNKGYEI